MNFSVSMCLDLAKAAEEYVFDSELVKKHGALARETVIQYTWKTEVASLAKALREV